MSAGSGRAGRIELVDALRAFALFGILQVNVLSFLWGPVALTVFVAAPGVVEQAAWLLVATFVSTKFLSLFAFLFGYGFALQTRGLRRGAAPAPVRRRYRRRLGFLLAVGVLHGVLLYFGDILTTYAVLGFVLLLYAASRPRRLAAHARGWFVGYLLLMAMLALGEWGSGLQADPAAADDADDEDAALAAAAVPTAWLTRHAIAVQGSYREYLAVNAADYANLTAQALTFAAPYVLGLFVLGALAGRQGWLAQPQRHPRVWRAARRIGWAALPLAAAGAWLSLRAQIDTPGAPSTPGFVLTSLSFPLAALYLSWIVRHRDAPALRRVIRWLAPAGRMPLTNYLCQSLAMGALLSGWGLGWGAGLNAWQLSLLALAFVAVQIVASRAWIARFGQGPVEALWKRVTYGGR